MLEYEWVTGNEGGATTEPDQNHHHHYHQTLNHNYTFLQEPNNQFSTPTLTSSTIDFSHYHLFNFNPQQNHPFFHPRAFHSASSSSFPTLQPPMFSLNQLNRTSYGPGPGLIPVSKPEHGHWPMGFSGSTGLGLNHGRQTYFRSSSDDFVNHRPNLVEPPRCQAQGCNADLSDSKHYHRRHKVCEFHSKAATVVAAGLTQRFCQQCSRFHLLSEFDNGKRSCRKRLADHNRRRRKTQHQTQENHFG